MQKYLRSVSMFVIALWVGMTSCVLFAAEPVNDVRILMDVSGSMKKTDPDNLRIPALRLLSELLPAGTRAGVWTFGRYVNMQVKLGLVDENWKQAAKEGAESLHSRALYTNIEEAIRRSTRDWQKPDERYQRSLILLTDGVVDISKVAGENTASRARILSDEIKRLQDADVSVYTVALSDAADTELLSELAEQTGGWFEMSETADQLQRAFLRMFDKTVQADTVPLEGNRFQIDASINEMTLLVFKSQDAANIELRPPGSNTPLSISNNPLAFKWIDHDTYELVTVPAPPQGEWEIIGAEDPDNRVVVVTDLRLDVADLPNQLPPENRLTVQAFLQESGEVITRKDFLELVSMTVTVETESDDLFHLESGEEASIHTMQVDQQTGTFSTQLPTLGEGEFELTLNVDGGTFSRVFEHRVNVQWPIRVRPEFNLDGIEGVHRLIVEPLVDAVDLESASLKSWLETADQRTMDTQQRKQGHGWIVSVDMREQSQIANIYLHLQARAKDGDAIDQVFAPFSVPGVTPAEVPPDQGSEDAVEKTASAEEGNQTDWLLIGVIGGGVFVVVLLSLGLWLFIRKKRRAANKEEPTEGETDTTDQEDLTEVAVAADASAAESANESDADEEVVATDVEEEEEVETTPQPSQSDGDGFAGNSADFNDYDQNAKATEETPKSKVDSDGVELFVEEGELPANKAAEPDGDDLQDATENDDDRPVAANG